MKDFIKRKNIEGFYRLPTTRPGWMRELIRILENRKNGYRDNNDSMIINSQWMRLFSSPGLYYPNLTEKDQIDDLLEYYKRKEK